MTAPHADPSPHRVRAYTETTAVSAHLLSDDAAVERTGRPWNAWFALLDAWGATGRTHSETTRWLVATHAVDGYWAETIATAYEGSHPPVDLTATASVDLTTHTQATARI